MPLEVFQKKLDVVYKSTKVYLLYELNRTAVDIKSVRSPYVKTDGTYSIGRKIILRDDGVWQLLYVHGEDSLRLPVGFWEALGME